jgi:multiple sugar transport system ATP-binding protein
VQTRAELSKLHKDLATTFIYVTHDQVEAMTMASRIAVMNYGVLQQIDTPHNLYEFPANKFVAGFIGSPAMNFFDAKLAKKDGGLVVDTGSFKVDVPKNRNKAYEPFVGKPVTFGVRPDDIHDGKFTPSHISPSKVDAKVEVVELMGNEIVAYLKSGKNSYVARVDPRSEFKFGDKVEAVINADNMHLFDKETEKAIR